MSNNDVVYYNLTIGDNDPLNAGKLNYSTIPASIEANNNMPILQNPDDYYGCIIRFSIPAINLPLMTFLIQTPVTDINLGIYAFTVCKGLSPLANTPILTPTSTSGRVFVKYIPSVLLPIGQIPVASSQLTQSLSPYYLLYDYTAFIDMWNTALATAHAVLYPSSATPFFVYDAPTQLISLYLPPEYQADNTYVCFNNQLLQYMVGIYSVNANQGGLDKIDGIDNVIIPNYSIVNSVTLGTLSYFKNSFQYNSYGYWNWLKTILITTTMNVNSEAVYDNNSSNLQNVNFVNILEDFMPDLAIPNGAGIANQIFTYFAQSLYRVFNFNQKSPLYRVNLAISMVDIYGNNFPLPIPKGQLANFKIMFIKKSIYSNMNKLLN